MRERFGLDLGFSSISGLFRALPGKIDSKISRKNGGGLARSFSHAGCFAVTLPVWKCVSSKRPQEHRAQKFSFKTSLYIRAISGYVGLGWRLLGAGNSPIWASSSATVVKTFVPG